MPVDVSNSVCEIVQTADCFRITGSNDNPLFALRKVYKYYRQFRDRSFDIRNIVHTGLRIE